MKHSILYLRFLRMQLSIDHFKIPNQKLNDLDNNKGVCIICILYRLIYWVLNNSIREHKLSNGRRAIPTFD